MEDWILAIMLIYFVAIPMFLVVVWKENNPDWLPTEQSQTFFEHIIDTNENLTLLGNILFLLIKAGALPSILIFQILKLLFIKQGDK